MFSVKLLKATSEKYQLRYYAFFMFCVLMQTFLVNIVEASGRPCPNPREGGCCAPNWCYCSGDNCGGGSAINDIAESLAFEPTKLPGVGTIWEIAKAAYNNWDDITDFFNPFNDSDPPPSADPLADRFDRLRNPLFGPGF